MKTLFKSLKITLVFCVFFSVFYILILWLFAQVAGPIREMLKLPHWMEKWWVRPMSVRCLQRYLFLGTFHLCALETVMMLLVRPVATKDPRIPNIWLKWKRVSIRSLYIILI